MVALATQDDPTVTKEFLRPVITGWLGAIKKADESKKWFNKVADQCEKFYSADMGFMWKEDFRSTFMSGKAPKFKITIAKAFEFVALYGPTLFWTNPTRELRPRDKLKLAPEHFLDYGQYAEQAFEPCEMLSPLTASFSGWPALSSRIVRGRLSVAFGTGPSHRSAAT